MSPGVAGDAGAGGQPPMPGSSGAAGEGGEGGAGGEPNRPECTLPEDCALPETKPSDCAEAKCNAGKCEFSARDADADGFIARRCQSLDPNIAIATGDDCDDADKTVNPAGWDGPAGGAHASGCNDGIDQDCSGIIDDGKVGGATCTCAPGDTQPCASTASGMPIEFPVLVSGKPVGECALGSRQCLPDGSWGECTNAKSPTAETCDGLDNDCNSLTDDNAVDRRHFYCDADNDAFLAPKAVDQFACAHTGSCSGAWLTDPALSVFADCDDADPKNYPGNVETCDGGDNNCDGIVDGKNATNDLKTTFYQDKDADNYGTDASATLACKSPGSGWVLTGGDCQDTGAGAAAIHPTAAETCNGKDDDCDGLTDADDSGLSGKPSQPNTTYVCSGGAWTITGCPAGKLYCGGDVAEGCTTDDNALTSCHACTTTCHLACGSSSCEEITALSAGAEHTCALTSAGRAACWGRNDKGQIGNASTSEPHQPTPVVTLSGVKAIAAGSKQSCAIVGASSNLYCWGSDASGQLGSSSSSGATDPNSTPVVVQDDASSASMTAVTSVATGTSHTCVVHTVSGTGVVACFGEATNGKAGDGLTSAHNLAKATQCFRGPSGSATPIDDGVTVVAGENHTCLLRSNKTVDCWGDNTSGQVGAGAIGANTGYATAVSGLTNVTALSAGRFHTCALTSGGQVYCWGQNADHQLGPASGSSYDTPQLVTGLTGTVTAIAAGGIATCVIAGGAVKCWGGNGSGQRGDATGTSSATPTTLGVSSPSLLTVGSLHACALTTTTKQAYCWGENVRGQLGIGTAAAGSNPTPGAVLALQ